MADTRVQLEVEDWVRRYWMPQELGQQFFRERVKLVSGGVFDFDAVSIDSQTVATISTSGSVTANGKGGAGKMNKLRSDMLFLMLAVAQRKIMILTELDMLSRCMKDRESGRLPLEIEFLYAELPEEMRVKLTLARERSSREMSGG